jgi:hypothetical protein
VVLSVTDKTSAGVTEERLTRRLRDAHLGSMFAALVALFGVLKVLAVSHFETTTALGIVAESGTASLVVGTMVRTIGPILLAALFLLFVAADDDQTPEADRRFYRGVAWALTLPTALLQPAVPALGVLVMAWAVLGGPGFPRTIQWLKKKTYPSLNEAVEELVRTNDAREELGDEGEAIAAELIAVGKALETALDDRSVTDEEKMALVDRYRAGKERWDAYVVGIESLKEQYATAKSTVAAKMPGSGRWARFWLGFTPRRLAVVYVVLAAYGLFGGQPWLPAERIAVAGQPPVIGYVLRTDTSEAVVLVDNPRHIVRLDGTVMARQYCWVQKGGSRFLWPIVALVRPEPSYPLCSGLRP